MLPLFALAAFVCAALLFLVQPMMGKALLPRAGGGAGVWTACMFFFQAALLAGYAVAHGLTTRVSRRAQVATAGALMAVGIAVSLRASPLREVTISSPELWVLLTLCLSVGVPFVVLSTASPVLQRWFSGTTHPRASDPYFLSIASNAGSAVGLLGYPCFLERFFGTSEQWRIWVGGLCIAFCLLTGAGMWAWRARSEDGVRTPAGGLMAGVPPTSWRTRLHWLALAVVPASLMVGVTQHITTDIAPVPLLWVAPLLLYLVSFMVAFSGRWAQPARFWGRVLPTVLLPLAAAMLMHARTPAGVLIIMHLLVLFVVATMCHRRLAELRPDPARLTEFYLTLAAGGVLGGAFNAVVAPTVFTTVLEYPLMLGAACAVRPQILEDWRPLSRWSVAGAGAVGACVVVAWLAPGIAARFTRFDMDHHRIVHQVIAAGVPMLLVSLLLLGGGSLRFAVGLCGVLILSAGFVSVGEVLTRERTFFGVHTVIRRPTSNRLFHGTTLHGIQARRDTGSALLSARAAVPGTYYHRTGPIGEVIRELKAKGRFRRAGFVGLGAGTMAAYAGAADQVRFYEIDPAVARIAQDPGLFSFVSDARNRGANVEVLLGDGRILIDGEPDGSLDLIAIDAFSSDAIPVHLITREATALYFKKVAPGGLVAFHTSNRSFNLVPVLEAIAKDLGLRLAHRDDNIVTTSEAEEGKASSHWVVLAREWEDMGGIARSTMWERPAPRSGGPLWTDEHSDVLAVFEGW